MRVIKLNAHAEALEKLAAITDKASWLAARFTLDQASIAADVVRRENAARWAAAAAEAAAAAAAEAAAAAAEAAAAAAAAKSVEVRADLMKSAHDLVARMLAVGVGGGGRAES
jgi:hypothetical protein